MVKYLCLIGILCTFLRLTEGAYTWHSTAFEFEEMLDKDLSVLEHIDLNAGVQAFQLDVVKKAVKTAERNIEQRLQLVEKDYRHPISYFRLLDSLKESDNIPNLRTDLMDVEERVLQSAKRLFPEQVDRQAVLQNLYSIQISLGLKSKDLARGLIAGAKGHEMTADNCVSMGNLAKEHGDDKLCLSWYEEVLRLLLEGAPSQNTESDVRDGIKDVRDEIECTRLCNEVREVTRSRKELKCYMWDGFRDPWLIMQPVKMEVLETEPYIYRFYDVISEDEIDILKSLSWGKLVAAKTQGDALDPVKLDSPRVAHHHYPNDRDRVVARLDDRVARITGLNLESSETLQVATYGIGGQYIPHYDAANITDATSHERTATFMFYLSDVQTGGATVFVRPGVAVLPQKGSALLWYNLHPSGYRDERTKHCACRIIVGNKWIANKWIHAEDRGVCRTTDGIRELGS